VIEHNLDVIKSSDWVIDLGPEGGDKGGRLLFEGTVNQLLNEKNNETAKCIKN
jgi:excinuclease ABC subunit A